MLSTTTITLTPQDTLASTLARLAAVSAGRVLLVVPRGLTFSAVELRVLRREAATRRVGLALLTSDAELRMLAAQAGISTFRSRTWAERARWHKLRPDRPPCVQPPGPAEAAVPPATGLYSRRSPTGFRPTAFGRAFARQPNPWWVSLSLVVVLLALFGGLLAILATVIPAATITLTPASEPIQATVALRAIQDAVPDADVGIVPARALSVQVSGDARISTTGRRYEPDAKATGQVVLINRTAGPIDVPAGTVVATATGNNVRFATTAEVSLAPNGRATVPVEAVLPGPGGNVRAGTITRVEGPLSLSLLVANEAPASGGTMALVGVVTEEDKQQLQARLFEELKQRAHEQLNARLEPGGFIPAETVTYLALSPTFTPFVGEVSPELFLRMTVQAVGLVVDTRTGNEMALRRLQSVMPPGGRLISDTVRYIPGSVVVEDTRTVAFSITAEGTLLRGMDVTSVRTAVLGMPVERATAVLSERFLLARPPQIAPGPDWLPYVVPTSLPLLPWRIRVYVDWDGAAAMAMPGTAGHTMRR
jgi:hypothetical protein